MVLPVKVMFPIPWRPLKKQKNYWDMIPQYDIKTGLKEAVSWYWNNLK